MKPEEPSSSQSGMSLSPQGSVSGTPKFQPIQQSQDAAAQVIRTQIDNLFEAENRNEATTEQSTPIENINPYQRTHTDNGYNNIQAENWKQYHTAWQNYYQKYYEGYYTHHLNEAKSKLGDQSSTNQANENKTSSTDEAIFDIRQKIVNKVHTSATKVRKSRHFIPILSGLIVVLIFLFLQYNRVIIANVSAYVSPGNIDPQNIVIDPSASLAVGPEPLLIIPKINVNVPVLYGVGSDYTSQMAAMAKGVAQFSIPGASSHPGQVGNTVIAGHSSNDLLDTGDYKFIFAQLDKLVIGDTIYLNYESIRYTYTVTKKEVVKPTETNKLVYATTKPILTLVTCTPLGTATNRLLVTAEQVSPDPNNSVAAPATSTLSDTAIPGNSPTLWERIFGSN